MVERTRELERALGSADKFVAGNEIDTYVVQRLCLRAARDISAGETITRGHAGCSAASHPRCDSRHFEMGRP